MSDQFVPPRLRTVLKTYQNSATKSLQGPGLTLIHPHKKEIESPESGDEHMSHLSPMPPPPAPIILPHPILTAPDSRTGVLHSTLIEGKLIGSFELGGEMRLCLAQFLNDVLTDFGMDQINRVFDELRIFCSQCTPEQLQEFKHAKIIPKVVSSCGLITRTNAERLCSALLHLPEQPCIKGSISFRVYHRCFGKCEGICTPEMYSLKKPACIQCLECNGFFSPQRFVCHVHRQENETCHWGFDSSKWRDYVHVDVEEQNREKFEKLLDALKEREREELEYLEVYLQKHHLKRKTLDESALSPQSTPLLTEDIPSVKKQKLSPEDLSSLESAMYHQHVLAAHMRNYPQISPSFRPWAFQQQMAAAAARAAQQQAPPPQSPTNAVTPPINPKRRIQMLPFNGVINPEGFTEPPILQNPDKVVRMTDNTQPFQSSLQPNVALAPRKMVTIKEQHHHHHHESSREKEEHRNGNIIRDRPPSIDRTINIKTEPQIKQEPPGTPPDMIQSPEIRYSPAGTTTTTSHHHHLHHRASNNVTPVSPTEVSQSGSNEITSSTSPVPAITHDTNTIIKKQESLSPPPSQSMQQQQQQQQLPQADHHLHHNHLNMLHGGGAIGPQMMHHHNHHLHHHPTMGQMRRGTPIPTENIHHRSQQLSSVSPPNTTKMNGVGSTMVGSELELSTDTDDESIAGEPDSSNTPYEIPSEFLKDVRPDHREKLINVIKALVQENVVARQENETIRIELQRKCDQFEELSQKYKTLQQQFDHQYHDNIPNNRQLLSTGAANAPPANATLESSVITTKRPDINKYNEDHLIERRNGYNATTTENNKQQQPSSEIIIKPHKKSIRRSPDETVVIMQQKRNNDGDLKILTNGELVRSAVN